MLAHSSNIEYARLHKPSWANSPDNHLISWSSRVIYLLRTKTFQCRSMTWKCLCSEYGRMQDKQLYNERHNPHKGTLIEESRKDNMRLQQQGLKRCCMISAVVTIWCCIKQWIHITKDLSLISFDFHFQLIFRWLNKDILRQSLDRQYRYRLISIWKISTGWNSYRQIVAHSHYDMYRCNHARGWLNDVLRHMQSQTIGCSMGVIAVRTSHDFQSTNDANGVLRKGTTRKFTVVVEPEILLYVGKEKRLCKIR